jgi:hypothetical protein
MTLRRLRSGEAVAGLGALALVVAMVLGPFGWLVLVPFVVTAALGLLLVLTTLAERTPAIPLAIGVMVVPWALLATLAALVRLLGGGETEAWLGLAGALLALVGTWRALGDERTDAAESRAQTERALAPRGEPRDPPRITDR